MSRYLGSVATSSHLALFSRTNLFLKHLKEFCQHAQQVWKINGAVFVKMGYKPCVLLHANNFYLAVGGRDIYLLLDLVGATSGGIPMCKRCLFLTWNNKFNKLTETDGLCSHLVFVLRQERWTQPFRTEGTFPLTLAQVLNLTRSIIFRCNTNSTKTTCMYKNLSSNTG